MKDFTTGLKGVSMTLDKCKNFLEMENEEVGEMVKYLLEYAMYGTEPTFRNKWQAIVYNTFATDIKHQIEACESRRTNCSKTKGAGSKGKSTHKTSTKVSGKAEPTTTEVAGDNLTPPTSTEVVKVVSEDIISPEANEVDEANNEDLTFATFISLYEKKDAGSYNTESAWNALSDDEKCSALRYVKENIVGKVDLYRRDFPSKFLTNHPWKK